MIDVAISNEIIYLILGTSLVIFFLFLGMIRISNGIISRKHSENREKILHLGRITKNHSQKHQEHEKKFSELVEENKLLKAKVEILEAEKQKREILDSTEQMIAKAMGKRKKEE